MLTYGFIYNDNPDPYAADGSFANSMQAVLVTEEGRILSGNDTSVSVEESTLPLGPIMLRQQTDTVEDKHRELTRRYNEAVRRPVALTVSDGLSDQAVVTEFVNGVSLGEGRDMTARRFAQLWGLDKETDARHEGESDNSAQYAPQQEEDAAPLNKEYVPRHIGGVVDVNVLRRARKAHMPLLLSGEPGTGKTTLAVAAFGEELITISCHEGMRREDLVGQWMPIQDKPGEFEWKDGPLVEAMLTGKPVLVDDFGWASPEVQAALLPVADHRRTISVIDRPEQSDIDAVDGFSLVLTHNPNMGVGIIDPIMDRMAFEVEVPTDLETADKLGVDPTLLQIAYQLEDEAKQAESEGSSGWVPSIRTLLETTRIQQVFGTEFAASAFLAACPIDQLEYRQRLHRMIQAQMGKDARVSDGLRSVASD